MDAVRPPRAGNAQQGLNLLIACGGDKERLAMQMVCPVHALNPTFAEERRLQWFRCCALSLKPAGIIEQFSGRSPGHAKRSLEQDAALHDIRSCCSTGIADESVGIGEQGGGAVPLRKLRDFTASPCGP